MASNRWRKAGASTNRRQWGLAAVGLAALLLALALGQALAYLEGEGGGGVIVYCWDGSSPGYAGCPPKPSLSISANVVTSYTRTFHWSIDVQGDNNFHDIDPASFDNDFTIWVDKIYPVDGWTLNGSIQISNSSAHAATITDVSDSIGNVGYAAVDCGVSFPYNLPGGQNLNCTFSATPPNGNPGTSLARVSTSGNVQGAETSTPFAFAGSPVLINDQIDVQDSDGGQWNFTDDGSTVYNKDYTCGDEGVNNYTATIVQTGQSDGAGVTITCLPGGGVGSGVLTITGETDPPGGRGFDYLFEADFEHWETVGGDSPYDFQAVAVDGSGTYVYAIAGTNLVVRLLQTEDIFDDGAGLFSLSWGGVTGTGPGEFTHAIDIAVDSAGNVYVADLLNHDVQKFDGDGNYLATIGSAGDGKGQFFSPAGIAVDASDNLYVADMGNDSISIFDSAGDFVATWGKDVLAGNSETGYEICTAAPADVCQGDNTGSGNGEFNAPTDVVVDGDGNVYVSDLYNNRIQKFDGEGNYLLQWGGPGAGDGEFNGPMSLAVDSMGGIYTADFNNHRIQKFHSNGDHIITWGGPYEGFYPGEFSGPRSIAIDVDGDAFVVDESTNPVQRFTARGARLDDGQEASFKVDSGHNAVVVSLLPDGWERDNATTCSVPFSDWVDAILVVPNDGDQGVCTFSFRSIVPAEDVDGVPDGVEDGAPNTGDGNNDGIPDKDQKTVASLPDSGGSGNYVTIVSESGKEIKDARNVAVGDMAEQPPAGVLLSTGVHTIKVKMAKAPKKIDDPNLPPGLPEVVITLYFEDNPQFDTYYKYGPTPDDPTPHWYEFLYDGQTGAQIFSDRVVVHLVDGGRGDSDLMVNGEIDDPGGPATIEDAELTIIKEVAGPVPVDWSFDFYGGLGIFSLTDEAPTVSFIDLAPGGLVVSETDLPGWVPSVSCLPGGESGGSSVTLDLEANESGTCHFVNTICAAGTYDNGAACAPTPPGYYTQYDASAAPDDCWPGHFQPLWGQPGCFVAEEGYYVPGVAAVEQTACPTGMTSPAGSDSIDDCVALPAAAVYMSVAAAGTTGDGLPFGSEDIIKWDGSAWSMWFDGSAAGLTPTGKWKHNLNAFWIPDTAGDDLVISFTQNARLVPGIAEKVDGTDLVWWDGSAFSLWFDGSDVGLASKTQEKIDGLEVLPGSASPIGGGSCLNYLLISTQGPGKVSNNGGGQIKFGGEDVLGFCMTNAGNATAGLWHMVLDGSAEGMPRNSTDSISLSDDGQTLYLTTRGAFNVDSASGGHSMVYAYDMVGGTFSGPHFDAAANGLPVVVDGLQVEGELN